MPSAEEMLDRIVVQLQMSSDMRSVTALKPGYMCMCVDVTVLQELDHQKRKLEFDISMKCISICRYVTDHLASLVPALFCSALLSISPLFLCFKTARRGSQCKWVRYYY